MEREADHQALSAHTTANIRIKALRQSRGELSGKRSEELASRQLQEAEAKARVEKARYACRLSVGHVSHSLPNRRHR